MLPYLGGEKQGNPHKTLFWRKLEESAVRMGDFKMITLDNYGALMYNLNKDLREINDTSKQNKSQLDSMFFSYHIWQQEMKTPLWVEGKDWMHVTYHIYKQLMQNKLA